jgi:hypothetical protein
VPERGFGRRQAVDARDARYPMRLLLDPLREQFFPRGLPSGFRYYTQGPVLDQGATGTCVAHAWAGWMYGAPLMTKPASVPSPYNLYRAIVPLDEWTDNDHEATAPDHQLQLGTSVRAGAQMLRAAGRVKNFLWADTVEDVRAWHLAGFGGVILGTWWTEGMDTPDAQGVIRYTGAQLGGHAYKTAGWTDKFTYKGTLHRAVRILNSWGRGWGQSGRAWVLEADLAQLIADAGECCAAVEQPVTPL